MNTPLPALQWKQNGVNHIVKLLPGGRIGALSDEILAEIRESNGKPDAKIMAIRSGNVQLVRQLQNEHIEGKRKPGPAVMTANATVIIPAPPRKPRNTA